ncbi:MAG: hypothetical protein AAF441_24930, partial [Pseudomonadota bacterium]
MIKTVLIPAIGLAMMTSVAAADETGNAAQSVLFAGDPQSGYSAADWGVTKLRAGSRKNVRRGKKVRRSKKVRQRRALRPHNFAVPGGFRLRRGGFNDDHTP